MYWPSIWRSTPSDDHPALPLASYCVPPQTQRRGDERGMLDRPMAEIRHYCEPTTSKQGASPLLPWLRYHNRGYKPMPRTFSAPEL